jgi:hypothetical protein
MALLDASLADLGQVVITPGALRALLEAADDVLFYLDCHVSGDYTVEEEYDDEEEEILRALSIHRLTSGEPLWISTDRNRKTTTVMLRDEYGNLPI